MQYSEPEYVEITPEMKARIDAFRDAHKGDPIGGVGTRVLFEDDDVRIWEMRLEPGEASDLHHHEHNYYLVIFSGDLVAGVMPEAGPMGDAFIGKIPPDGNTVGVPKGNTEWAFNVGEKTYYEILIELKKT
jgi:redox-sensitive bicupin YhaK (pirin superfamily)